MLFSAHRRTQLVVLLAVCLMGLTVIGGQADEPKPRPAIWAEKLDRPGLPNLHRVDAGLYRGAQPKPEGIKELQRLGVKTIINLRSSHSDKELVAGTDIAVVDIPLNPWKITDDDLARFLRVAADPQRRPVFFHCQHGADRTGVMCAAYRVAVQGWTKKQAVEELTDGGYGFHSIWSNLPRLIENLDVEQLKTKSGLERQSGGEAK